MNHETPVPVAISLDDGTQIPVTADQYGFLARHDGVTYHLTATVTGARRLTPAQWCKGG